MQLRLRRARIKSLPLRLREGLRAAHISLAALLVVMGSSCGLQASGFCGSDSIALSVDENSLFIPCPDSGELLIVDILTSTVLRRVPTNSHVRSVAVGPKTGHVFVTQEWDDSVLEIDPVGGRALHRMGVGKAPVGLSIDPEERTLMTANRLSGDVSFVDLISGREVKRLPIGPGASEFVRQAEASNIVLVTRFMPTGHGPETLPVNVLSVVDVTMQKLVSTRNLPGIGAIFLGDSRRVGSRNITVMAGLQPNNSVPTGSKSVGNVLILADPSGTESIAALDDGLTSFANPFDIKLGTRFAFVSASGSDRVGVFDIRRAANLQGYNPLGKLYRSIPVGRTPRGMALSRNSRWLYVVNQSDDTVIVIDAAKLERHRVIALSDRATASNLALEIREGKYYFNSAQFAAGGRIACASCHPEGLADGLTWNLRRDQKGHNLVATRALEGLKGTAPYKWNGTTKSLHLECGALSTLNFFETPGFSDQQLGDLVAYLENIPVRPRRPPNGQTNLQVRRGQSIFERKVTTDGRPILHALRCPTCHPAPLYTSNHTANVGTRTQRDDTGVFDTPHLLNLGYKTSYLHDGRAESLGSIFREFNGGDLHGVTSDLSESDMEKLVEYLKTL